MSVSVRAADETTGKRTSNQHQGVTMDTTATHAYKAIGKAVGMHPGWIITDLYHADDTWHATIKDEADEIVAYASFEDHGRCAASVLWA